jgi:AcrR family transcriptional regulator
MNPTFIRPQKKQEQGNPLADMPLLFDSALTEFADKSFDTASLNDIIKRCGLSKGSFYHKFNDKLDLYLCLMDIISQKKAAFTTNTAPATDDFFEMLRSILGQSLKFSLQDPRYNGFWHKFLAESNFIKEAVQIAFPRTGGELERLIEKASDKGQLNFPAPFVLGVVNLLISQLHMLIREDMSYEDIQSLENNIVDMLKRGLAKTISSRPG